MIRALISLYSPHYPIVLVYMLQSVEYRTVPYLRWFWQTQDFSKVENRGHLHRTLPARLLLMSLAVGILLEVGIGLLLVYFWFTYSVAGFWGLGLALIIGYPIIWAHMIVLPLLLGRLVLIWPRNLLRMHRAEQMFRYHAAEKIAIVGSYGKTSMKELLLTVLGEGLRVAATPANENVALSHALFARQLTGAEDVLLIEYGEGKPGDIMRFSEITHPTRAVITGVAAAHLDRYGSTDAAGHDIFSVASFVTDQWHIYANEDSKAAKKFIKPSFMTYSQDGALGWKASGVEVDLQGLRFTLTKGSQRLKLRSALLGRHNIGPLSLAAALAIDLGVSPKQVVAAIAKTVPFEHRMQPYQLGGGWVIDDTYNGNIEGIRAGTELLHELPAKRKLYVTPGLVDQGRESKAIHEEMGRLIAQSGADMVVLMQNSVTKHIQQGLEKADFKGELLVESDPLTFYTNLNQFVAAGDLVMLQNDWPDNYA